MTDRTLTAIHDPRGRLSDDAKRRRLRAAHAPGEQLGVHAGGALTAAWTQPCREQVATDGRLVVIDGDVDLDLAGAPRRWPFVLREARGAFALIAWEGASGLLARDHLGARPLFFANEGSVTYAASEVSTLLRLLPRRPGPETDALRLFLGRRVAPEAATLYQGVRAVAPAHALVLDGEGSRLERFWRPQPRAGLEGATAHEAAARLRDGVLDAVRRHGGGAPDAGVLLSGGLDSSAVFVCAAESGRADGSPPIGFSGTFPHAPELDEGSASMAVAKHWGCERVAVPLAHGRVAPAGMAHLDRWGLPLPYPGGAFFRPVVQTAASRGIRVLLDGEGGDELFGCEPLLLADRLLAGDVLGAVGLARALPGVGARLSRRAARDIVRGAVLPGLVPPVHLERLRRLRGRTDDAPAWLSSGARDLISRSSPDGAWWAEGRPRWRAHLGWVLSDGRAAMAMHDHLRRTTRPLGIVDAHPFLDVDLVELVLGLPPEHAFDPVLNRPLLRTAMRGLIPDGVRLRREKVYFDRLLADALTGPDRTTIDAVMTDASLELAAIGDPTRVRALWSDGPSRHPRGPPAWASDVWRVFAAETWLRREAGREVPLALAAEA